MKPSTKQYLIAVYVIWNNIRSSVQKLCLKCYVIMVDNYWKIGSCNLLACLHVQYPAINWISTKAGSSQSTKKYSHIHNCYAALHIDSTQLSIIVKHSITHIQFTWCSASVVMSLTSSCMYDCMCASLTTTIRPCIEPTGRLDAKLMKTVRLPQLSQTQKRTSVTNRCTCVRGSSCRHCRITPTANIRITSYAV